MDEIYKRLNSIIEQLELPKVGSKKRFAENIGISTSLLSHWLSGRRKPTSEHLLKIQEVYNVNLQWVHSGNGKMLFEDNLKAIQISTSIDKTLIPHVSTIDELNDPQSFIAINRLPIVGEFAVTVMDNSMSPYILKGDIITVVPKLDKKVNMSSEYCLYYDNSFFVRLIHSESEQFISDRGYIEPDEFADPSSIPAFSYSPKIPGYTYNKDEITLFIISSHISQSYYSRRNAQEANKELLKWAHSFMGKLQRHLQFHVLNRFLNEEDGLEAYRNLYEDICKDLDSVIFSVYEHSNRHIIFNKVKKSVRDFGVTAEELFLSIYSDGDTTQIDTLRQKATELSNEIVTHTNSVQKFLLLEMDEFGRVQDNSK